MDILDQLSLETVAHVLSFVEGADLGRLCCLSKRYKALIDDSAALWKGQMKKEGLLLSSTDANAQPPGGSSVSSSNTMAAEGGGGASSEEMGVGGNSTATGEEDHLLLRPEAGSSPLMWKHEYVLRAMKKRHKCSLCFSPLLPITTSTSTTATTTTSNNTIDTAAMLADGRKKKGKKKKSQVEEPSPPSTGLSYADATLALCHSCFPYRYNAPPVEGAEAYPLQEGEVTRDWGLNPQEREALYKRDRASGKKWWRLREVMRYSLSKHGPVGLRQLRERKRLKSMERAKKKGNVKLDLGKKLEKKGFLPSAALLMRKPNTSKALKESLWRLQNYRVMKERRQRVMAFFLNRGIDWSLVHRHRLVKKYITQYTKEVTRADLLDLAREVGRKRTELQKKLEQRSALTVDIEKRAERIKATFAEVGLGEDIFEDLIKDESLAFYEWVLTGEIRGPAATPNGGEGENSGESKQKGKSSVVVATGEEGVRRAMADGLKWSMVKMVLQTIRQVLEKQGIPWRWVRNNARDQKEGEEGQKPWKLYKREAMAGWNLLGPSRADEQRLLVRQEVERLVALREARERRKALVKRLIDDKLRGRSNNNQVILKKLWQLFALDEDTYDVWEHYELDFWKTEIAEKITSFIKGKGFSSWRSNSHNASSSSSSASSAMEEAASLIEPVVEKLVAFVIRKEELRQALHFLGYGMPPSGIVSTPFRLYMEGNDKVSLNDCALALARGFNKAEMEAMRAKMAERRSAEACEGIHPYLRRKEEERLRGKDEDDDEDDDSFDDEERPKTRCLLLEEGEWTSSDEDEEEELIAKRGNKKKRSGYSHRLTVSAKKKRKRKSGGSSGGSRAPKRKTKRRRKSRSSRTLSPNQQSAQTSQEEDDDDDDAEEEESEEEEEDEDGSEEEEDEEEEDETNADSRFHPYNFFFKRSPGYR